MKAQIAHPRGTMGTAVGDSKPGIRPIRLQIRMKRARVIRKAVKAELPWPMISWLWSSTKPWAPSKMCCRAPGLSTDSLERTMKNTSHQKQKYQELHRHRIRYRRLRILGLNVERSQQPRDRAGEEMVQKFGKPELFRHESRLLAISSWPLSSQTSTALIHISGSRYRPIARAIHNS